MPNIPKKFSLAKKWVRTDAWRGYEQPKLAVAGASDTGMASDSPCPSDVSKEEVAKLAAYLKSKGIATKVIGASSSNVFMGKRWIVPAITDYPKAKKLADAWLKEHESDTQLLHGAD